MQKHKISLKNFFPAWIRSGIFGGLLGESMYRYTYDLDTGTSHYKRNDGTVDSWQSPQRRGNGIRRNAIYVLKLNHRRMGPKGKLHFRHPALHPSSISANLLLNHLRLMLLVLLALFLSASLLHFEIEFSSSSR